MRYGILIAIVLILLSPGLAADEPTAEENPWVGKSRAEVVELLGEPQSVKRGGERLTYKFVRVDPLTAGQVEMPLIAVPGIGIGAQPDRNALRFGSVTPIPDMAYDKHGWSRTDGSGKK
ncbi:MAG: hypothetical protein OES25_05975 [Acidobacteriota bacterium]|nr:hypothetical protein [Acidobacteriota bacterium]